MIPVSSLKQLRHPAEPRRPFSLIAPEKHLDWLVRAVIEARQTLPELTLDIYGQGADYAKLQKIIADAHAADYIHLKGQQDPTTVYPQYAAYALASTGEGFGLSLLETIGVGLPLVGFDVPYGNQTMIDDGRNGYLLDYEGGWTDQQKVHQLAQGIIRLFSQESLAPFLRRLSND